MSSFQLFYGQGKEKLKETRPELSSAIPYERLQYMGEPVACGDFAGHRSVYGAGYLMWLEALVRTTNQEWVYALDVSITDWLAWEASPIYLIQNPFDREITVHFTAADIWKKQRPQLFAKGFQVWELFSMKKEGDFTDEITITLAAGEYKMLSLLTEAPKRTKDFLVGSQGEELLYIGK